MNSPLDVLIARAKQLAKAGDDEGAMSLACELTKQHPREMAVWSLRAYLHGLNRDHLQAIEDLTRAIEINQKEPKLFYDRGIEELALRDNQAAVDDFTAGLELCDHYGDDSYREELHFLRAEAFLGLGRKQLALADLQHAREDLKTWTFKSRTKSELLEECRKLPCYTAVIQRFADSPVSTASSNESRAVGPLVRRAGDLVVFILSFFNADEL
jgi:tetratricopeptide (TPR) repeat protein